MCCDECVVSLQSEECVVVTVLYRYRVRRVLW